MAIPIESGLYSGRLYFSTGNAGGRISAWKKESRRLVLHSLGDGGWRRGELYAKEECLDARTGPVFLRSTKKYSPN